MHVLPLPFGLALALLPRTEARRLRRRGDDITATLVHLARTPNVRDQVLGDPRFCHPRQHVL